MKWGTAELESGIAGPLTIDQAENKHDALVYTRTHQREAPEVCS